MADWQRQRQMSKANVKRKCQCNRWCIQQTRGGYLSRDACDAQMMSFSLGGNPSELLLSVRCRFVRLQDLFVLTIAMVVDLVASLAEVELLVALAQVVSVAGLLQVSAMRIRLLTH